MFSFPDRRRKEHFLKSKNKISILLLETTRQELTQAAPKSRGKGEGKSKSPGRGGGSMPPPAVRRHKTAQVAAGAFRSLNLLAKVSSSYKSKYIIY